MRTLEAYVILAAICAAPLSLKSLAQYTESTKPPITAPPSCGMTFLAPLAGVKGSKAYVSFRYQLTAIDASQEGLDEFDEGEKSIQSATDLTQVMSGLLKGAGTLHDHFSCAAYVIGRWKPTTEREQTIRLVLISAYNRIASDMSRQMAFAKQQFLVSNGRRSKALVLRDAERAAAIDSDIKTAQKHLLEMTVYSLLLAVDLSDATAKTTPYMVLTCSEREEILAISKASMRDQASNYEKAAGLIHRSTDEHQCHTD